MVQELVRDITRYFDYLNSQGYYIAFHNLSIPMDRWMRELTPYNINSNPFCLLVKSSSEAWTHCVKRQERVLKACAGGPFCGMCYAGMGEYVFPVFGREGEPLAFLSVSGYQINETQAMQRIAAVARRYHHSREQLVSSWQRDLKSVLPEQETLSVQIAPLARMFELLNMLLCDLPDGAVGNPAENNILSHAVVYLRRHYAEKFTAADVANACHCSVSTLGHMFKRKMGISIREYVQQLRMADAVRLLKETELPISAISDLIGYGNSNYFCNVFRQERGMSPTQFREQLWAKESVRSEGNDK